MKTEYVFGDYILKVLTPQNADIVLDFYSRNRTDFDKYESKKPEDFYTKDFVSKLLNAELNGFIRGNFVRFFQFSCNNPDHILGTVSFSNIIKGTSCTVGYKTDKDHRRQGIASFMVQSAMEVIIHEKGVHRIEAYILPDNTPSIKLIKKLDFIEEGVAHSYAKINGIWQDHNRYAYISLYQ